METCCVGKHNRLNLCNQSNKDLPFFILDDISHCYKCLRNAAINKKLILNNQEFSMRLIDEKRKKYPSLAKMLSTNTLYPSDIMNEKESLNISNPEVIQVMKDIGTPCLKAAAEYFEHCRILFDVMHSLDPIYKKENSKSKIKSSQNKILYFLDRYMYESLIHKK